MAVFFGAGDPAALQRLVPHRGLPVGRPRREDARRGRGPGMGLRRRSERSLCRARASGVGGGALHVADFELLGVRALTTLALADRDEALEAWETAMVDAHRRGSLYAKAAISLWRGLTLYRRGELADAEQSFVSGLDEYRVWGPGAAVPGTPHVHFAAFLSAVRRERGDLVGARRVFELARDAGDRSEAARYWCHSQLERLVAEDRPAEAVAAADDAAERFAYLRNPIDTPWRSPKAVALDRLGRTPEAMSLLGHELRLAREWGAPGALAHTLRVLGTLERDAGLPRLHEAVEAAAGSPARLEHAKALYALGAGLRRAGRAREARLPLREAIELAGACGAQGLLGEARTELYAAVGRPRTAAPAGPAALSASERRVALLAAQGTTNREIAQALFVTPRRSSCTSPTSIASCRSPRAASSPCR